jgi:alpha,alpha-trehalose phosphorylase
MIHRPPVLPPEHVYPIDDWRIIERGFQADLIAQNETLFAVSNGYLGLRGNLDEGRPAFEHGTFVSGFHETWPIIYGEDAYGFAKTGQTMLDVTDGKVIRLYVDDEPLHLPTAHLRDYERVLDMRTGTLDRYLLWQTAAGKQVAVTSRRFASLQHRHLAVISYEITVLNADAPVAISSALIASRHPVPSPSEREDPRRAPRFQHEVLVPHTHRAERQRLILGHSTERSGMTLAAGAQHVLSTDCPYGWKDPCTETEGRVVYTIDARAGAPIHLVKYLSYHTSRSAPIRELCQRVERTLDRAAEHGLDTLAQGQRSEVDAFWERSDIQIEAANPRAQQSMRFNLFQLMQATARAEGTGIGARGLTGAAYEGHYFWDIEAYVLPFLVYSTPRIAQNLLRFRHGQLDQARERARELGERGALFPWRTINGDEASAYYAAGTAQYHINADVVYALKKYVEATADEEFLYAYGAEILAETARLWTSLGFHNPEDGRFHIHGVTGPDEYNTVVDDNTFTNLMARLNLNYAARSLASMESDQPKRYAALASRIHLHPSEREDWLRAADSMYVPFDEAHGIHPQDDTFLEKEAWDFAGIPPDKYPLLLHFHPLVIYRHQVIKQADIVMAMFLLGEEFSLAQKKRNFDYYNPITTGDSSLSACIESIIAMEIGYHEVAVEYLWRSALVDLSDVSGNVRDGIHLASTGGTWMAVVYGIGGLREQEGTLSFQPRRSLSFERLRFPLNYRDSRFEVEIAGGNVSYRLLQGPAVTILHFAEPLELRPNEPITLKLSDPK